MFTIILFNVGEAMYIMIKIFSWLLLQFLKVHCAMINQLLWNVVCAIHMYMYFQIRIHNNIFLYRCCLNKLCIYPGELIIRSIYVYHAFICKPRFSFISFKLDIYSFTYIIVICLSLLFHLSLNWGNWFECWCVRVWPVWGSPGCVGLRGTLPRPALPWASLALY